MPTFTQIKVLIRDNELRVARGPKNIQLKKWSRGFLIEPMGSLSFKKMQSMILFAFHKRIISVKQIVRLFLHKKSTNLVNKSDHTFILTLY